MVHFPVNVFDDKGAELAEQYDIGSTFPVFILTNSGGEIITRWTGYTGAESFIRALINRLGDLTTINGRIRKFNENPTMPKAIKLGDFFSGTGEYLRAIEYFKRAEDLRDGQQIDLSYRIFTNTANAVWKEMTGFTDIYDAADAVLERNNKQNIANMALIMSRLTRKFNRTDSLSKYLEAGMDAAIALNTPQMNDRYNNLKAEQILQVVNDTSAALSYKKTSMGSGWESNPQKFYPFSEWCLERKINLEEAEKYALKAAGMTNPGTHRARVYRTAAELSYLLGKTSEAIRLIKVSIEEHPANPFYKEELERYENSRN